MKTKIIINKNDLYSGVENLLYRSGDNNYSLYAFDDGSCDAHHNTARHNGVEILNAYNLDPCDENGNYPGDENYNYSQVAKWIVDETDYIKLELDDYEIEIEE